MQTGKHADRQKYTGEVNEKFKKNKKTNKQNRKYNKIYKIL